jgi:hypothetical protein
VPSGIHLKMASGICRCPISSTSCVVIAAEPVPVLGCLPGLFLAGRRHRAPRASWPRSSDGHCGGPDLTNGRRGRCAPRRSALRSRRCGRRDWSRFADSRHGIDCARATGDHAAKPPSPHGSVRFWPPPLPPPAANRAGGVHGLPCVMAGAIVASPLLMQQPLTDH